MENRCRRRRKNGSTIRPDSSGLRSAKPDELEGKLPFSHGIWHLFVLGGSIMQFLAIFFSVP